MIIDPSSSSWELYRIPFGSMKFSLSLLFSISLLKSKWSFFHEFFESLFGRHHCMFPFLFTPDRRRRSSNISCPPLTEESYKKSSSKIIRISFIVCFVHLFSASSWLAPIVHTNCFNVEDVDDEIWGKEIWDMSKHGAATTMTHLWHLRDVCVLGEMISEIMTFMKSQIFAQELFTPFDITSWTNGADCCCCCFVTHPTDQPKFEILTIYSFFYFMGHNQSQRAETKAIWCRLERAQYQESIQHLSRKPKKCWTCCGRNSKSHCVYYLIPLISFMFFSCFFSRVQDNDGTHFSRVWSGRGQEEGRWQKLRVAQAKSVRLPSLRRLLSN